MTERGHGAQRARGPVAHAHPMTPAARRDAVRAGIRDDSHAVRYHGRGDRSAHLAPVIAVRGSGAGLPGTGGRPGPWPTVALVVLAAAAVVATTMSSLGRGLASSAEEDPATTAPTATVGAGSTHPSPLAVAPIPDPSLPTLGLTGYRWPVDHARITTWFGPMRNEPFIVDGRSFHDGIDIASFCGDHVDAAHDGVVLVAGRRVDKWLGWVGGYDAHVARLDAKDAWAGLPIVVIVDDGDGYRSIYMHLGKALVKAGEEVEAGQLIGYEGRTGNATGCHLHYSIFDPTETAVFETAPAYVKRYALPTAEVARIDPLLVLPPMATVDVTWGWGARD